MGMSASQARFLMLTARKNNVEFEGQQINQQRTTLSNESASYYSELCNMVVPTPPSIDDYTKVSYTFDDGALTNTITTMIAKNDGKYTLNYVQQWQDDYSIVSASSSMIARTIDGLYKVGATTLRTLGTGNNITIDGVDHEVKFDSNKKPYYEVETGNYISGVEECTPQDIANFEYWYSNDGGNTVYNAVKNSDGRFTAYDDDGNAVQENLEEDALIIVLRNENETDPERAVLFVGKDDETGKYIKETYTKEIEQVYLTDKQAEEIGIIDDAYVSSLTEEQLKNLLEQEEYYTKLLNEMNHTPDGQWYVRYVKDSVKDTYVPYFYNKDQVEGANYPETGGFATGTINCFSIGSSTKTREIINAIGSVEKDSSGRYISLLLFQTDEDGNIKKDANGNEVFTQYSLTTNTSTDEDAYNDAMNQYNYKQYKYDQRIQEINSKIEVVQQQDKSLELELKQLDTEENAISTEMEAVKKVISKNVDSSFKTFNA